MNGRSEPSLYANCRAEVANGEAARMTFYRYDFVDGTAKLNLRGADKMQEIRAMLPTTFAPVVVERTPDRPTLAEARRAMLRCRSCRAMTSRCPRARGHRQAGADRTHRRRGSHHLAEPGRGGPIRDGLSGPCQEGAVPPDLVGRICRAPRWSGAEGGGMGGGMMGGGGMMEVVLGGMMGGGFLP